MFSWEYDILRTLLRHKAGPLQDTVKIELGLTMLFAQHVQLWKKEWLLVVAQLIFVHSKL